MGRRGRKGNSRRQRVLRQRPCLLIPRTCLPTLSTRYRCSTKIGPGGNFPASTTQSGRRPSTLTPRQKEAATLPDQRRLRRPGRYQARATPQPLYARTAAPFWALPLTTSIEPGFSLDDYIDFMGGSRAWCGAAAEAAFASRLTWEMGLPLNIGGNSGIAGSQAGASISIDHRQNGPIQQPAVQSLDNNPNRSLRRESFLEGGFITEEESRQRTSTTTSAWTCARPGHRFTQAPPPVPAGSYTTTELESNSRTENFTTSSSAAAGPV